MKSRIALITLMCLISFMSFGRMWVILKAESLIADAKLAFVGRVISVNSSNFTTTQSYEPYATFRWKIVEVDVIEPFKGVRKGDVLQVAMLAEYQRQSQPSGNSLGMLYPHDGDIFFFCLGATPRTNAFAALGAPYNENTSVFPLYRNKTNLDWYEIERYERDELIKGLLCTDSAGFAAFSPQADEPNGYKLIFALADDSGKIQPAKVNQFREMFVTEIAAAPSTNLVQFDRDWRTDALVRELEKVLSGE